MRSKHQTRTRRLIGEPDKNGKKNCKKEQIEKNKKKNNNIEKQEPI